MSWQDVAVVASVELLTAEAILGEGGQRGGAGGGGGPTVAFEGPAVDDRGGHGATVTTVGERPSSTAQRSGNQERERTRPASAAKTSKSAASGSNSRRRQAIWLQPGSQSSEAKELAAPAPAACRYDRPSATGSYKFDKFHRGQWPICTRGEL